ncbi:MAG: DUF3854 domain-containing protein [Cyanobacteria bacterium REEB498]|nr:DUF3854 domain-containing protein [Cyanobacteria bacterium REEB498]
MHSSIAPIAGAATAPRTPEQNPADPAPRLDSSDWRQTLTAAEAWELLPQHLAELQASGIPTDLAAANVASWGPGTLRHWEDERAEVVRHARLRIQTASTAGNGHQQSQPGHLAPALIRLDKRYQHLAGGGWRSLGDALPGLQAFDQWKPDRPRQRHDKPGWIKYEAPAGFPDGGGLLLPRIPEPYWRRICQRQGLPFPAPEVAAAGFWAWALATPGLQLLICEGLKKALSAVSAGHAAVALPGVQMGRRVGPDGAERLIEALQLLAPGRQLVIVFDAERKVSTARKVRGAAAALARTLRAAGGRPSIARLPLLAGSGKTGLDDLLVAAGPEALDQAVADTSEEPVLPWLRHAHTVAPAGAWLADAAPIPAPEAAPLVVVQAPMGCGKTRAVAAAVAPLQAAGVPLLLPSHRQALGRAAAEALGVPWMPKPGSDDRQTGVAACLDSWCPVSGLRIGPTAADGGVLVLDEVMQQLEHLLGSTGTALGDGRRAAVLRTLAQQLPRTRQLIAMDAQLGDWAVQALEALTGRRAHVIRSDHQPMAGRQLHCQPHGDATAAARQFRARWWELVHGGRPFLCWVSAQQQDKSCNAAANLAQLHCIRRPMDRVLVIDSSTPEAAARLAADPDGEAARWDAIYCTPAISSGLSFQTWKPAAVIAYSGGRLAPEHVVQAVARVRSPEVPVWIYAPERCPGADLRVGSGAKTPDQLLADLRATTSPLRQLLEAGDPDGAWLRAWAEMGAVRNRQRHAYQATIAGLLQAEGWALQAPVKPAGEAVVKYVSEALGEIREAEVKARYDGIRAAELLDDAAADALRRKRQRTEAERHQLERHDLARRWALGDAKPSQAVIEADDDGLVSRLRLGWMLTTPEALALLPEHDRAQLQALDPEHRQPFLPDQQRKTATSPIAALFSLQVPALLQRFAAGEVIAATDPAVVALHAVATAHRRQLVAALGVSPGAKASGTLRELLKACGWKLEQAGRIKSRGTDRDAYRYTAQRVALPKGVQAEALAAAWLAELAGAGAKTAPIGVLCRGRFSPTPAAPPPRPAPPPFWQRLQGLARRIPWPSAPPPRRPAGFAMAA